MSKKYLIVIVIGLVVGGVVTAATYPISRNNSKIACVTYPTGAVPQSIQWQNAWDSAHPPVPAREKGFPLAYYRQAFPANCSPEEDAAPSTGLLGSGLILDYLIWSAAAFLVCLGIVMMAERRA